MLGRCGERYTKRYLLEPIPQKNRAKLLQKIELTKFSCIFFEKK